MSHTVSLTLSVPLLDERRDDYIQDVGRLLPGVLTSWHAVAAHLTLVLEVGPEGADALLQRAAHAIRQPIAQAVVLEAGPDLLPLAAIAGLAGLPRDSLEKLRDGYPESFPRAALHASDKWHLTHVLRWIRAVGAIHVDTALLDTASACERFNAMLRARRPWRVA
jgi:hypothetical protein